MHFNEEFELIGENTEIFPNPNDDTSIDVDGFINNYKGGFSKRSPMNLSNPMYFSDMFQREVVDQGWLRMRATIACII